MRRRRGPTVEGRATEQPAEMMAAGGNNDTRARARGSPTPRPRRDAREVVSSVVDCRFRDSARSSGGDIGPASRSRTIFCAAC